jgi:hypothetical protein
MATVPVNRATKVTAMLGRMLRSVAAAVTVITSPASETTRAITRTQASGP